MALEKNIDGFQIISEIKDLKEVYWQNTELKKFPNLDFEISFDEILEAEQRLKKFSPFLKGAFKDENFDGIIESPIKKINCIEKIIHQKVNGDVYLKSDDLLPIAGSVKARGGVYEVLKHAEDLLIEKDLLKITDDYSVLLENKYKKFLSNYTVTVGSTGNLGLSIGIMSKALGFNCVVHMSKEAQNWKKNLLRSKGVKVIEHQSDYSKAVFEGRKAAENEANNYFVDDEKSIDLFLGYAVAGLRLKRQLIDQKIEISKNQPLNVYIPCGVGGAPSGIAYGLKYMFKDYLNVFFIEPTHSPCVTAGMVTGLGSEISVKDLGIDNKTIADGLAVGRASALACKTMKNILTGCITVSDEKLYQYLGRSYHHLHEKLEPSATAGFEGLKHNNQGGTHIVWATGGSLMPEDVFKSYLEEYNQLEKIKS
jgi:D-serine dehydratase